MAGAGEQLQPWVGELVGHQRRPRCGRRREDDVEPVLRTSSQQHVARRDVDPSIEQVGGHSRLIGGTTTRRLLGQERPKVALASQFPQSMSQLLGLLHREGLVEGQVSDVGLDRKSARFQAREPTEFPHVGAPARFADDQTRCRQFPVRLRGCGKSDPPLLGQLAMRR